MAYTIEDPTKDSPKPAESQNSEVLNLKVLIKFLLRRLEEKDKTLKTLEIPVQKLQPPLP